MKASEWTQIEFFLEILLQLNLVKDSNFSIKVKNHAFVDQKSEVLDLILFHIKRNLRAVVEQPAHLNPHDHDSQKYSRGRAANISPFKYLISWKRPKDDTTT